MILVPLRDVPRRERHLLFCSDPEVRGGRPASSTITGLDAINRTLAAHGEAVDAMWPTSPFGVGFRELPAA
ncbi:MAG: hypothetical protein B6D36_19785 [Planctomycetes bacterium UTPLA1]|jgi:hypothetical protein|nr:MAG: hypothetical protein B6D36_19785 [Planctomycetes bacterium UTPLA1]